MDKPIWYKLVKTCDLLMNMSVKPLMIWCLVKGIQWLYISIELTKLLLANYQ